MEPEAAEREALQALLEAHVAPELRDGSLAIYERERDAGRDHAAALRALAAAVGVDTEKVDAYLEPAEPPASSGAGARPRPLSREQKKRIRRRAALKARGGRAATPAPGPRTPATIWTGIAALALGLIGALYFGAIYDTSVEVPRENRLPGVDRVYNVGRGNTRTVGMIGGVGVAVVGGLLLIVGKRGGDAR